MEQKVTAVVRSIGTTNGKAVVRIAVTEENREYLVIEVPTSVQAFAALASAGLMVVNK